MKDETVIIALALYYQCYFMPVYGSFNHVYTPCMGEFVVHRVTQTRANARAVLSMIAHSIILY